MNPVLLSTFAARFGPWLGRVTAASPGFLTRLVAKLRVSDASGKVGASVNEVIAYAKASPGQAILVMTTLASLGMSVVDLFGGDAAVERLTKRVDPESAQFLSKLALMEREASVSIEAFNQTVAAADSSTELDLGIARNRASNEVAIEILSFAKRFFGSPSAALEGHRLLQSFMEMPHDDVVEGFTSLRVR